ncbi:AIPR family protein [Corynebacterium wankanglinii]|uniref:Abortive phage infection protein C-terminal domain-containing protein n=1 Tax=Corynebacterium wankanglinii TaxID=2735136 RepID=A0A838CMG9_9CORY|nr:AIPR family protein [Corynebacterium wankanglinii]MBA1836092.1 hypothetical protein [Corynebacterium wankanglinii]
MDAQTVDRSAILKVEMANDTKVGPLRRITGLVQAKGLIDLITSEDLEANPRRPKRTSITEDIVETLQTAPEMMAFYSKGLLIGCSEVMTRDRDRFQLHFEDPQREGVLDGGHNLMAIALALLNQAGVSDGELRKVKFWDQLKDCWNRNYKQVSELKRESDTPTLEALVPVEIVAPLDESNDVGDTMAEFNNLIISICANRNQNAQLAAEAIANQSGVFDFLKASLPEELVNDVTWSTNDNKRIDPRMLVSLAWVSLGEVPTLENYNVSPLAPTTAYSGKAESLKRFRELMEAEGATEKTSEGKSYVVIDDFIASAFEMVPEILKCYDIMYKGYKDAYNTNGGAFGRISAVKKSSKGKNVALVSNEVIEHEVPPAGYLMPVVFSLQALLKADMEQQKLVWLTDPVEFFSEPNNLAAVVGAVKPIIEMANWDPTTVGKNAASYNAARAKARTIVLESLLA